MYPAGLSALFRTMERYSNRVGLYIESDNQLKCIHSQLNVL